MNIAMVIKTKRESLHETLEEFGNRFGVDKALVSNWEAGRRKPKMEVIDFVLDLAVCPTCNGRGVTVFTEPKG